MRRTLALLLALLGIACAGSGPEPPRRVIFITIDTLRADHLGSYGYPRPVSPFLDRLASEGVVFGNAIASSSHTAPCHASLFTGLQPVQHRVLINGEEIAEEFLTLAELFRDAGYATAGFTTTGFLRGLSDGFDHFASRDIYVPAQTLVEEALDWLGRQRPRARVFAWVHLFDVHEWHVERHVHQDLRAELGRTEPSGEALARYVREEHGIPADAYASEQDLIDAIESYDAQILAVDRQVERLFTTLEAEELAGDTLWVITSDHGEGLGNHHYHGHGRYIYDEQIRVPLIVYFGDRRYPPQRVERQVQHVDVPVTLAGWIGRSFDGQLFGPVGRSLAPLLTGSLDPQPQVEWDDAAYAMRRPADERRVKGGWEPGDVVSLQDRRTKIILKSEGGGHELYDLETDPFELENLFAQGGPERDRLMRRLMRQHRTMEAQGAEIDSSGIAPEHIEQLKALGYL